MESGIKVIITLSHTSIQFEYVEEGAMRPFFNEWPDPVPLAFLCSDSEIIIGEEARRAYASGNTDAFIDLFSLIKSGQKVRIFGTESIDSNKLLLRAIEEQFKRFLRQTLLGRYGELDALRSSLPVIFAVENDIMDNERTYLLNLFRDGGYACADIKSYDEVIISYFEAPGKHIAIANAQGGNLYISLEENPGAGVDRFCLNDFGMDPRVERIAEKIWEQVSADSYTLQKEDEMARLKKAAADFIGSGKSETEDCLTLSDGCGYDYYLSRIMVDSLSTEKSGRLRTLFNEILDRKNIDRSELKLILRGETVGNSYFKDSLCTGIPDCIEVNDDVRKKVKLLLFSIRVPSIPKGSKTEPTELRCKPPVKGGLSESEETSMPGSSSVHGVVNKREIREMLADILGKCSGGLAEKALDRWKEFNHKYGEAELDGRLGELYARTSAKIDALRSNVNRTGAIHSIVRTASDESVERERHWATVSNNKDRSDGDTKKYVRGIELLKKRKFREARDEFKACGDVDNAKKANALVRPTRAIKARFAALKACSDVRNVSQAKTAITEIREFLRLVKALPVQVDCTPEENLLRDYEAIK